MFSKRAWRFDEARAGLRRTSTNPVVFGAVRSFDVEGDERRCTRSAKAAREVEAGFAETKESNLCHGAELTPTECPRRCGVLPRATRYRVTVA